MMLGPLPAEYESVCGARSHAMEGGQIHMAVRFSSRNLSIAHPKNSPACNPI